MIRNILFDWSGTLVNDLPAVWRATNHVFQKAGVPEISLEAFRQEFCLPFRHFYDRFLPNLPGPQLESWFHGYYRKIQNTIGPIPCAKEFLEFCRIHQVRTFVLSTIHRDYFNSQATAMGFRTYFEAVYVEITDKKKAIVDILNRHQLAPESTLLIGDMQHDIETAQHGGILSCGVLTGYNTLAQLRVQQPDVIVENLDELRTLLLKQDFEISAESRRSRGSDEGPVVTVGALIFDERDRVLLVRTDKWSGLWGIPGGKIKYGETSQQALRRELKEETNLEIDQIRLVMVQDCIQSKEFYRESHFVLLNYVCQCVPGQEVRLNAEAQAYQWLSLDQSLRLPLNEPTRRLINTLNNQKTTHSLWIAS